jgi:hypothetical protein
MPNLHGVIAQFHSSVDGVQNPLMSLSAGHDLEPVGLKSIEADVEKVDA